MDTTKLLNELSKENTFFLNIDLKLCAILLCIILICLLISCFASFFTKKEYKKCKYEYFDNEDLPNLFHLYKNINYSNYVSISLLPENNVQSEDNVLFGQATRFINNDVDYNKHVLLDTKNNAPLYYTLDISANLYILGGHVYDEANQPVLKQKYYVRLSDLKNKKSIIIGDLVRDGDGMYKLKYKVDLYNINKEVGDLLNYNIIEVVYSAYDVSNKEIKSDVILKGEIS